MKTLYHIDAQYGLVLLKFSGVMNPTDANSVFEKICHDGAFKSGFNIFMDMSELNQEHMDYESMRKEKASVSIQIAAFKKAKIAGFFGSLADFGRGRQWVTLMESDDCNIQGFMDLPPLRSWLNLPDDYVFKFKE